MGVNTRYFIITIISIFFALGVGIFIGFMFDAQEILTVEREGLIEALNDKFHALELENRKQKDRIADLLDENKSYKDFSEYIFPQLISNRLTGITVGFLHLNNEYSYSDIEDLILMAGGKIIPINSYEASNSDFVFRNNIRNDIGNNTHYLDEVDYYLIALDCKEFSNADFDVLESFLSNGFIKNRHEIIAVEKKNVEFTFFDRLKNHNITTINNIDTIIGKISLIFTLDKNTNNNQVKSIINRLMKSENNNLIYEE